MEANNKPAKNGGILSRSRNRTFEAFCEIILIKRYRKWQFCTKNRELSQDFFRLRKLIPINFIKTKLRESKMGVSGFFSIQKKAMIFFSNFKMEGKEKNICSPLIQKQSKNGSRSGMLLSAAVTISLQ